MSYNGGLEKAVTRGELLQQVFRLDVEFSFRHEREAAGCPPLSGEEMGAALKEYRAAREPDFPAFCDARAEMTDAELMHEGYKTDDLIFDMLMADPSVEWHEWEADDGHAPPAPVKELPLPEAREALAAKLGAMCQEYERLMDAAKASAATHKAKDKELER